MKDKILFVVFVLISFCCVSQDSIKIIDSLKQVVFSNPKDSIKIKSYSDLCWYYRNISIDSAFVYGNLALSLSKETGNNVGEAQAYNDIGILHYGLAEYSKSLNYYKKSLEIRTKIFDTLGVAGLYNKIGLIHQSRFKMDSAIFYATKALKIYKSRNHIRHTIAIENNIANIYKGLKQYKKALNAHLEIAKTNEEIKNFKALVHSYNNIANAFYLLNDTLQSSLYYEKGIKLAEAYNYEKELSALYNNYGGVLHSKGAYNEAFNLISKSFNLRTKLNDNYGIASTALHLGGINLDIGKYTEVEDYLRLGLKLAQESNANELKMDAFDKLSIYFTIRKKSDSILHYKNLFRALNDSVFSSRVTKEVAEIQEKYNTIEREKHIETQRANLAEKELHINQKNTQITGLGVLAIVLLVLGYLVYKQQKLKNNQLKKESELKEALVKIETQNKLNAQRLKISRDLHDNIGAQLTFIISSIDNLQYGFKISNKKISDKLSGISAFTKETIYELRDTIWAMNKNAISLEDLQGRISNFIDNAAATSNSINFNFNIDESLSEALEFKSVVGMNIYRIIQEAINNAIKYSEAPNVIVNIEKTGSNIKFSIKDDGKGFNEKDVTLGSGLNNMKKRAHEIGAVLNIKSDLGSGTLIILEI